MSLVDESGRLFGRVNVVDAAVVLVVVLAVVGAGVVLLGPVGGSEVQDGGSATRYATIALGEQAPSTADRISAGDSAGGDGTGDGAITVTDAYVGPGADGSASVVVRVRIDGTQVDGEDGDAPAFEFRGEPLHRGDDVEIETAEYDVGGEVLALDTEGDSLTTASQRVLVEAILPAATAEQVERGDRYRLGNHTVATVEDAVIAAGEPGGNWTGLLALSLRTFSHSDITSFGGTQLQVGRTVGFSTEQYALSGTVTSWGEDALPPEPSTRTVEVKLSDVRPEIADGLAAGMVERRDGATIAEVTNVRTEPATVVLTSDDGNIYEREHPRNLDVYLAVDLGVRQTEDGLTFRLRPLREGTDVQLDFRSIVADGTVTDVDP